MTRPRRTPLRRRLPAAVLAAGSLLFLLPLLWGGASPVALGHAQLVSSEPGAAQVVSVSPAQLTLAFSEPIDASGTSADVLDSVGHAIVTEGGAIDPTDPFTLLVPVPTLADGAYSVQWRSLSAADGHTSTGFFTFGVGSASLAPDTGGSDSSGGIHAGHGLLQASLETVGRTLGDLGAMLAFGFWAVGFVVVRPLAPGLLRPIVRGAVIAGLLGAVGAAALAVSAADHAALGVAAYLTGSRSGELVLARGLILVAASVIGYLVARQRPASALDILGLGGSLAIGLLAASGHAAGVTSLLPVAAMFVHIASAAVDISGLLVLSWLGISRMRQTRQARAAPATDPDPPLGVFVPRFSALALVSVPLFALTGIAFAEVQNGGLIALDTQYGVTLAVKIVLVLGALAIGAWNYLDRSRDPERARLRPRVVVEAGVAVTVVFVTALLASGSPPGPAQPVALAPAGATTTPGISLALLPARPGPNRFVVTLGPEAPDATVGVEVLLQRLDADLGSSRIALHEVSTEGADRSTWQADGGLLAPDSSWTANVVLDDTVGTELARQRFDLAMDATALADGRQHARCHRVGGAGAARSGAAGRRVRPRWWPGARHGSEHDASQPAWRWSHRGQPRPGHHRRVAASMILLVLGVVALMAAAAGFVLRRPPLLRTLRIPAAITGVVLIAGTLLSPPATPESGLADPVPLTVESAAVGAGIFQASCAACHGVDARGGGSAAGTTAVRPPALTGPEGHLGQHSDGDLHYWIGSGLPGGMPAWGTRLSSDQIWAMVDYLRSINGAPFRLAATIRDRSRDHTVTRPARPERSD